MTSLRGKVIAINGAASGIGLATAQLLAERGATLSLSDLDQAALDTICSDLRDKYHPLEIHARAANVVKSQEVATWLDETIEQFGKLDGAANLAGIVGDSFGNTTVQDMTDQQWDTVMEVNVRGVFNCLRAELQRMKSGSIVNATSAGGTGGVREGSAYCASKVCL